MTATLLAFTPTRAFLALWLTYLLIILFVIVPVAVVVLGRLVLAAVRLLRHARIAREAAAGVRRNTQVVPALAETLRLLQDIEAVANTVDQHGVLLEQVLQRPQPMESNR